MNSDNLEFPFQNFNIILGASAAVSSSKNPTICAAHLFSPVLTIILVGSKQPVWFWVYCSNRESHDTIFPSLAMR